MYEHQNILVANNLVEVPNFAVGRAGTRASKQQLATVLCNITYYGYGLSAQAFEMLSRADEMGLVSWWGKLETVLKAETGDDKNMADFVVYKNFPAEVLDMTQGEYWFNQILMYWGLPNHLFTQEEVKREIAGEDLPKRILHLATDQSLNEILHGLLQASVRWTNDQWDTVSTLVAHNDEGADVSTISFKENMVKLAAFLITGGHSVTVQTATDVLRLAIGMSDGDIAAGTAKFRRFKRAERRFLLSLLDSCKNLEEDVSRKRGQFKRLFHELRPGDYKTRFKNVVTAYDKLYRGVQIKTFNSEIEQLLADNETEALSLLKSRPGEFLRRLRVATQKYGNDAVAAFSQIVHKLSVHQLVKLKSHLQTVNSREHRTFAPKGNWTKLQIVESTPETKWDGDAILQLIEVASDEITKRVSDAVPSVKLGAGLEKVKLQTNDSDLSPYGRGTVFDIPENITFLRSASYWEKKGEHGGNIWYDNGWNFFTEDWKDAGVCCWTDTIGSDQGAVFSGDPTNSKEMKGRACQMIDLYIDKLRRRGVRYAVWNILCFSHLSFDKAEEVYAALQWGEEPQANKLFEPSRAVLSFPLKGANLSKYIAYIDLEERKLVYIDANLYGRVSTARANTEILEKSMPAFVEYVESLPSVVDLFEGVPQSDDGMPVVYDDTDEAVERESADAYVFLQRNEQSQFNQFDLNSLLKS